MPEGTSFLAGVSVSDEELGLVGVEGEVVVILVGDLVPWVTGVNFPNSSGSCIPSVSPKK